MTSTLEEGMSPDKDPIQIDRLTKPKKVWKEKKYRSLKIPVKAKAAMREAAKDINPFTGGRS